MSSSHVQTDQIVRIMRRFTIRSILLVMFVFVPIAAYLAVTTHDEHIEHCTPPKDAATARICDWTFPLHNHPVIRRAP